jgi:hypothetical protein
MTLGTGTDMLKEIHMRNSGSYPNTLWLSASND